ncbi:MAG: radical SAM protein [Candidatus Riflebacteria bacterium]|nr:radical SAM protein [Candidatus Riflebacteria bacterium]
MAAFFKEYLAGEKVVSFDDRFVVNTSFPPIPSGALDNMAEQFNKLGQTGERSLYSVTWAVTNRCSYRCWHCYNAGRSQDDLPLETARRVATELSALSSVMVTLTGGEPLLRADLEEIAGCFDRRTCLILGTTGDGLTRERADRLKRVGVFGVGVSLDSAEPEVHDRLRGRPGAFATALAALRVCAESGLYPYVVAVATRELLEPEVFWPFLRFARRCGALEVHLLEPSITGRLAGRSDVALTGCERDRILDYQRQVARDDDLPILSTFTYLESEQAFGCGAGLTHLYIDGAGEVCPCNLVPISFGNVATEPLAAVLERMGRHFERPRTTCVGRTLARHIPGGPPPTPPPVTEELCSRCLEREHPVPRFFAVRAAARDAGRNELQEAYDSVHDEYDRWWTSEAREPVEQLVAQLGLRRHETIFEAGCGTGCGTVRLASSCASVVAVDLSEGMLGQARARARALAIENVRFEPGDALEALAAGGGFDVVFSSWVLGYIPLEPFFAAAAGALADRGRLAFVVHRESSPRDELELFEELVARDPSVLSMRVRFDFPRDADHVRGLLAAHRLAPDRLTEGAVVFRYRSAREVLDHLLKSGAGTAFHRAIVPERRQALTDEFLELLTRRKGSGGTFEVRHDYVSCIAVKGGGRA